jgi:hypothetical protein
VVNVVVQHGLIIAHTRVDFATDAARVGLTVPARPTLAAVMERKMALGRAALFPRLRTTSACSAST